MDFYQFLTSQAAAACTPSDPGTTTALKLVLFALNIPEEPRMWTSAQSSTRIARLGDPAFNHIHGNIRYYPTVFAGDTSYQIGTQPCHYGSGHGNLAIVRVMLQY
jgi:hypothetical protein